MTLVDLWLFIKGGGVTAALAVIIVASMQGRFVWKREYDRDIADERREKEELRQERDAWRAAYFRSSGAAQELIQSFAQQVRRGE